MGNFNMKNGSKEKDTPGTFSEKQTDTVSKVTNNAKYQKYIDASKKSFPSFDQKKDTVVSTTSKDRYYAQSMNNMKAHAAQVGDTGGKAVSSSLIGSKETSSIKGNSLSNREYTFKRKVKKPKK
jgi:hypothetical protein